MKTCLRYLAVIPLLLVSPLSSSASKTSPEALVVMVYISTLRCDAQHPKLKKSMDAAYAGWVKRNKKYVDSAKQRVDFNEITNLYKSKKAHDKRIPFETCKSYVKRLQNPANDIRNTEKGVGRK
jgi:hypothetical protein